MKQLQTTDGGFLQSKHWATFKRKTGAAVFEFEQKEFRALAIEHDLPIAGKYWFIPRGPQAVDEKELRIIIRIIIRNSLKKKIGWVRVEPQTKKDLKTIEQTLEGKNKILKSKKNHQPAQTLMVNLTRVEGEILAQMKSKTRYNIRLADKKGVKVFESKKENDVKMLIELIKATSKREKIIPHPDKYYQTMIKSIPDEILKVYFAEYQNQVISSIVVSFYGGVATYLHGASANEHRNVMAPFALQWKAMLDAKRQGCDKYDLGGTKLIKKDEKWVPAEGGWKGISRFKQGFCPDCEPVEFPGCWDVVLDSKKYFAYKLLQNAKDMKNKLIR